MSKPILLLICILGFISCAEVQTEGLNSEASVSADSLSIEIAKPLTFTDVIPESLSDTAKVEMIAKLINEVNQDTSLMYLQTTDSLDKVIFALYRADTLVKIIEGAYPYLVLEGALKSLNLNYTEYYFLKDSLIASRYSCSTFKHTAMCNPVSVIVFSIYYNQRIISQAIEDHVSSYPFCGCDAPVFNRADDGFIYPNYKRIDYLKNTVVTEVENMLENSQAMFGFSPVILLRRN